MRKIFVALGAVATAAGVAWLNRDRLLPLPEPSTAPAPRFRPAPPGTPAAETGDADDLTRISGIGPVYSGRLATQGVNTFADLASADTAALAAAIDVAEAQVAGWADQARALSS